MKKTIFTKLIGMLPLSPGDARQGKLAPPTKGTCLQYRARLTSSHIEDLIHYCTGEDPTKYDPQDKKNFTRFKNWRSVPQRDEDGDLIRNEDRSVLRRWEPVHFKLNRFPTASHIKTLRVRIERYGYIPVLRSIVFAWDGRCLDGQHSLIALWYYLQDSAAEWVDIDVKMEGEQPDSITADRIFRMFDQALRRRTLKDALSAVPGLPAGFIQELAGTLRFAVLLASGRGINSSRLSLPHITNEKGKEVLLQPDDIAAMLDDNEPFHYVQEFLTEILAITAPESEEDGEPSDLVPAIVHSSVSGSGKPNPQYYLTAMINCYYDSRFDEGRNKLIKKFQLFLLEIIKAENSDNKAVLKLISYHPKKSVDWLPAIESMLQCFLDKKDPPRNMTKALTYNGIQQMYSSWANEHHSGPSETEDASEEEETEPRPQKKSKASPKTNKALRRKVKEEPDEEEIDDEYDPELEEDTIPDGEEIEV